MSTTIAFSLNFPIQSCHAHQIRPVLPTVLADADVQRTIAMNKISTNLTKKIRLETKKDFLPLTPTIVPTRSPIDIDIQEKLESLILKTVDCEIIDLFNQMKSKPTTTAFNENLSTILAKLIPSEHKYFFGNVVITDKIDSLSDDQPNSMTQERRLVMDQLRTLEFVQLQAFARVLQKQNKKSQTTIDKLRQQMNRIPPAQLIAESIKKHSLDKMTFALLMERILSKVDQCLSNVRDECYVNAVNGVQTLVQKDLGATTMMSKIEQELSRQRTKVHHLTSTNEKYNQLVTRLLQDIQQIRDLSDHDAKEAKNMRIFLQSLHDATYQHRLDRTECEILKRTTNQLELGFFDRHVHLQLDGKGIGRVSTWSKTDVDDDDDEEEIEAKLTFSADENFNSSQTLAFDLLKTQLTTIWNRPLTTTFSRSNLIEIIRKFIENSLIANNLCRTLIVCLESLPCKLIDQRFMIDWSTNQIRLDIEWELDERIFRHSPLKSSYCCQPQHNGLCNELQTLLDRMKPINGSMVSLYEQVEEHVRPWLKILDGINDSTTKTSTASISLYKLKQSLEKLFLEQN